MGRAHLLADLSHVSDWIFDLDNTLYPAHVNLFEQVDVRMKTYIAKLLNMDVDAAFKIQKDYYHRYGTTLKGLMLEHQVEPHDFLHYVHDIDHAPLEPDPALGEALALLNGRKFILTNGSVTHAKNVIARLGIPEHFEDIFDIVAAQFEPKPQQATYEAFVARNAISCEKAVMFEDLPQNLEAPKTLGMATVLVVERGADKRAAKAAHIDLVIDDLTGFLADFTAKA
jgi:putative hydrolase of the HAD superfamily